MEGLIPKIVVDVALNRKRKTLRNIIYILVQKHKYLYKD